MPTFHNTRWPLLTDLLQKHGWKQAAKGEIADLSFVDDGSWQKEEGTEYPGKIRFFSRVFTDLLSNKRSFAIGLRSKGCIPGIMTSTFTDFDEWAAMVQANKDDGPGPLWFWKKMNAANSKGISVTRTVEGGRQILSLDAACGKNAQAKGVLASTFDDGFMVRMSEALKANGCPEISSLELQSAFLKALGHNDMSKIRAAMRGYIVQKEVQRPLLIKEGRKFCLRIYVVAVVRPLNSESSAVMKRPQAQDETEIDSKEPDAPSSSTSHAKPSSDETPRELEVYVSPLEIGRPQKAPFSTTNTDPAAHYQDSSTLYVSVSDGTCYPKERWEKVQFPRIKDVVRRVMGAGGTSDSQGAPCELVDVERLLSSPQYQQHFRYSISRKTNPVPASLNSKEMHDKGRLAVMGWDFMFDEDDKPWLLEVNGICNLKHSPNSKVDTYNKTNLAQGLYDVVLNPVFGGVEVKESPFLHRVI